MPTDSCVYFYQCAGCHALLRPKPGDCCVFCSFGSVKCPPVQQSLRCCDGDAAERIASQAPVREGFVPVPGAQLYFREVGSGSPLVIVHGGPDFNHNYLVPDLDPLSSAFRLIYYDQRGRGRSSQGVSAETVDIDSEVEDVDRLRQYFGLGEIALLGHSWGCVLALEYASRHADRISHLILLNAAPASHADLMRFRRQREATDASALAKMRAIASSRDYADGDIEADAEYYRAHFGKTLCRSGQLESVIRRLRSHFTPQDIVKARAIEDRLYAQTWQSPEYDVLARLGALDVPALIIHGDRDLVPLECARNVAAAIPGARLVVIGECGHFSHLECPGEVCNAIAEFVLGR